MSTKIPANSNSTSPIAAGDRGSQTNTASSVTRCVQNPEPTAWALLLTGIDTLDLGLYVRWDNQWEFMQARLETWKARAAGTPGVLIDDLPVGKAVMLAGGKPPMYRYHLQVPEFHIFLGKSDTYTSTPNVYVSLTAHTLWHLGPEAAVSLVWGMIEDLGGQVDLVQPSRCDLCADFLVTGGLSLAFLRAHRVSRSRHTRHHETGNSLETFYIGSAKSPVTARIYDKGLEIHKSKKLWFKQLWGGLETVENVWRIEFQVRRPALKAWRIESMHELRQRAAGLWRMLTGDWLSLRLRDNPKAERRTVHPWWRVVHECSECFGSSTTLDRREREPSDSAEWHEKHIAGCLSSYAAIKDIGNFDDALAAVSQSLRDQVNRKEFGERTAVKAIRLGKTPSSQGERSHDR